MNKHFNFNESYLNESFFDDIEDDISNDNVFNKNIDEIYFSNKLYIIADKPIVSIWLNNKLHKFNVTTNEISYINFKHIIDNCNKSLNSWFYSKNNGIKYIKFNNCNVSDIINMGYLFSNSPQLTDIIFDGIFNTSNVKIMTAMFNQCRSIRTLDLSSFDTANVKYMNLMFNNCVNLFNLNISNFNTSNVVDMTEMFYKCISLIKLDLSSFNTSNVNHFDAMFAHCQNLKYLDISNFIINENAEIYSMFDDCNSLETIKCNTQCKNVLLKYQNYIHLPKNINFILTD